SGRRADGLDRARAVRRTLWGGRSVSAAARRGGAPGPGTRRCAARDVFAPVCAHLARPVARTRGGRETGGRLVPGARSDAAADAAGAGRGPGSLHGGAPRANRARGFALE